MQALLRRENRLGLFVLLLFAAVVAFVLYWRTAVEDTPGDYHVKTGNYRLQDGQYDRAIAEFELALEANADHPAGLPRHRLGPHAPAALRGVPGSLQPHPGTG